MSARVLRRSGLALALAAVASATPQPAAAVPAGGAVDNPRGAVATVSPNPVAPGGTLTLSGAGFTPGEEVTIKLDDGAALRQGTPATDVFARVTAQTGGTLSGTIDLTTVSSATPLALGSHGVRLLSSSPAPRSLKAAFEIALPAAGPAPPSGSSTPQPGTSGATAPATATPGDAPPTTAGDAATTAPLIVRSSVLRPRRGELRVKLRGLAAGAAGRVRVKSVSKLRTGGGKSRRRVLAHTGDYFVDVGAKTTISLRLSRDGQRLLRKRRSIAAVVQLRDASGASIQHRVTVKR